MCVLLDVGSQGLIFLPPPFLPLVTRLLFSESLKVSLLSSSEVQIQWSPGPEDPAPTGVQKLKSDARCGDRQHTCPVSLSAVV